jgi:DNA-binding transcriptional regulator YiaG
MKRVTKDQLPEVIRQRRGAISLATFGNRLGVPKQTVYAWEAGEYMPKPEMLEKLKIRMVFEVLS